MRRMLAWSMAVLALAVASSSRAECRTVCMPDEKRDANNCCTPVVKKAAPSPGPISCAEGQVTVANNCCWPGQDWGATSRKCVGTPKCPFGMVASGSDCQCEPGRVSVADHCCWPGQDWGTSSKRCVGVPSSCPAGDLIRDEMCVKDPLATEKSGCDANDFTACDRLGDGMLRWGGCPPGTACSNEKNPVTAVWAYSKACTGGVMAACPKLGLLYMKGQGVAADVAKGIQLVQQGCRAHASICDCVAIGLMRGGPVACYGVDVQKDSVKGTQLAVEACGAGMGSACYEMYAFYWWGRDGVVPDGHRAGYFLNEACQHGFSEACSDFNDFQEGCRAGDAKQCLVWHQKQ